MAKQTEKSTRAELFAKVEANRMSEYPARLMTALEEATVRNNYELTVQSGMFRLLDRDEGHYTSLSFHYDGPEDYATLEELEWDLRVKADEREEARRKQEARLAALAKLTAEDRAALGL